MQFSSKISFRCTRIIRKIESYIIKPFTKLKDFRHQQETYLQLKIQDELLLFNCGSLFHHLALVYSSSSKPSTAKNEGFFFSQRFQMNVSKENTITSMKAIRSVLLLLLCSKRCRLLSWKLKEFSRSDGTKCQCLSGAHSVWIELRFLFTAA